MNDTTQAPVLQGYLSRDPEPLADWVVAGTQRHAQVQRRDAQQGTLSNLADGFAATALSSARRVADDEGASLDEELFGNPEDRNFVSRVAGTAASRFLAIGGMRASGTEFSPSEHYADLTQGIPYEYHDEIMDNDSLEAAQRARQRIQEDLNRGRRIAQQDTGGIPLLAGALFDADLPLTFLTGGAYGSAKIAGAAARTQRRFNFSTAFTERLSGTLEGANAGLQAGALVGALDAATRETATWQDLVASTFTAGAIGGGAGGVLKGEALASWQAAQRDFNDRVARADPALDNDLDVESLPLYAPSLDRQGSTVGAAQVGDGANVERPDALQDPNGAVSPRTQEWVDSSREWRDDSGFQIDKDAVSDTLWGRVASSSAGAFSANNFMRLYNSGSAVANRLAGTVFESPSGLGRGNATASVLMESYQRRIQTHIATSVGPLANQWARKQSPETTFMGSGYSISSAGQRQFNREVMLELNDRALGRPSSRADEIKQAADRYESAGQEALAIGRGRDGQTSLDGFEDLPDRRGYTPYSWSGRAILDLEQSGRVTRDAVVRSLADAYRQAGMSAGKDADAVAKAVVSRAVAQESDIDTSIMSLMSADGREWLAEALRTSDLSPEEIEGLMKRLTGDVEERRREGFAKHRNEVDMNAVIPTADGSDLRVVDLMDNNLHGSWQRYSRKMAGSSALARVGITNRAQRREVIEALRAEQRSLGEEPMDVELLEAMFSHFNGGPVHGYSRGHVNEGVGTEVATAKRIAGLSLLERLGLTQLAETGATMAQNGLENWARRGPMALFDKEMKAANKELLDDLAYVTGRIGDDHLHFAQWLDLDDVPVNERTDWLRTVGRWTSNAQYIQGYTSAFNHVRRFQQTTAVLGAADKLMRGIKSAMDAGRGLDESLARRMETDFGISKKHIAELEDLIESGVVEFTTRGSSTFVNRLNVDQWPTEIAEVFGAGLTRNMNQLVQKSMAGEQDAWMHTQWGTVLTHLKTFPMQAVQKQFLRNARHLDLQTMNTVMMGMATAYLAIRVRDALDGKERSSSEYAKAAFNYSNMTGFVPMYADPLLSMLGLEDMRFNQYGPYTSTVPPIFSVADDLRRVPGALMSTLDGETDYQDQKALRALPFAGTYLLSRAFD